MDSNFDLLIKHENENTSLDFKKSQYIKANFHELLKDVIAFSNGNIGRDSHIILGMKVFADGRRNYIGIPEAEFTDSSDYQQLIENNIEPSLDIDYVPYKLESKTYGILVIKEPQEPPYMMKKDYTFLKKGEAWIRKGSNQERLTRRDLDYIQSKVNSQMPFEGNVSLEFGENEKTLINLKHTSIIELPSERAKKRIQNKIKRMEDSSSVSKKEAPSLNSLFSAELQEQLSSLPGLFGNHKEPTLEELHSQLKSVSATYHEDDLYELFEKDSHKIQLVISNNCDRYLEDVSVKVSIKKQEGLLVADRVYEEPEPEYDHPYGINLMPAIKQFEIPDLTISYPFVDENDNEYLIHDSVRQVEHHKKALFFSKPLRIKFGEVLKGQQIFIECKMFAKNLKKPLNFELKINID